MDHLRRLGNRMSIPIQPDADRFTGRECPNTDCGGYFKIEFGTGLPDEGLPCHCPYCGQEAPQEEFCTTAQIEYAQSLAMRKMTDAFFKDLKKLEFDHKPRGAFGIGFSMKVKPGRPIPIRYYREKALQTEVICDHCTLRYAIFGVFAFCPDCGRHNSYQMLIKNLEIVTKKLDWCESLEPELAGSVREDALASVVAAFDGFGREVCSVLAKTESVPAKAAGISFQNLEGARRRVQGLLGFDLAADLDADEWAFTCRCFQKRHLLAHKMGVVDQDYIAKANDYLAVVGRRISVSRDDVAKLLPLIRALSQCLMAQLRAAGQDEQTNGEE